MVEVAAQSPLDWPGSALLALRGWRWVVGWPSRLIPQRSRHSWVPSAMLSGIWGPRGQPRCLWNACVALTMSSMPATSCTPMSPREAATTSGGRPKSEHMISCGVAMRASL